MELRKYTQSDITHFKKRKNVKVHSFNFFATIKNVGRGREGGLRRSSHATVFQTFVAQTGSDQITNSMKYRPSFIH